MSGMLRFLGNVRFNRGLYGHRPFVYPILSHYSPGDRSNSARNLLPTVHTLESWEAERPLYPRVSLFLEPRALFTPAVHTRLPLYPEERCSMDHGVPRSVYPGVYTRECIPVMVPRECIPAMVPRRCKPGVYQEV